MLIGTKYNAGFTLLFLWIFIGFVEINEGVQYLGKFIGKLSELHHGVSGEVYAVDARTLHIKGFTFDGEAPATYFYVGNTKVPGSAGLRLRDENGRSEQLKKYRGESITLTLPEGRTLGNIRWFSVWCHEAAISFGDLKVQANFDYPRPQKIDPLNGVHAISSDEVVIVDAQTLLIPHLSYDGEAPDAKFWAGRGPKPSPQGIRIPDENGKEIPLRRYDRKTVVLTLPGELTVFDIGHFGVWCEQFTVDFGHIQIPSNLNVPPSLKMLGVSPQSKLNCEILLDERAFEVRWAVAGESIVLQLVAKLEDNEYMSFGLSGEDHASVMIGGDVVVAWVNKETLKGYADDYYLGDKSQCAGYTGSCPDQLLQDGADAVRVLNAALVNGYSIVTYQRSLNSHDRFDRNIYTNQSQPIIWAIGPLNDHNQVSYHSRFSKGNQFIDFGRPAKWNCPNPESDQSRKRQRQRPQIPEVKQDEEQSTKHEIPETTTQTTTRRPQRRRGGTRRRINKGNQEQVVRAPPSQENERLNTEITSETPQRTVQSRRRVNGRNDGRNAVKLSESTERQAVSENQQLQQRFIPWTIPPIQCYEPEDGVFYAQMGPAGGKKGYQSIAGHVGWGIAWYINGLLIPEINVVRGKTYTFVVEGGDNEEASAQYHPFYITDDPVGGYVYKTPEEREKIQIFAGAVQLSDGSVKPTGVGRLCHWTYKGDYSADDYPSFGAYQRHLELKCAQGEPGIVQWTPDKVTPDTVYYQCFSHRHLGWKINVLDSCDELGQASEVKSSIVLPPKGFKESDDDLESDASYRVATVMKLPPGSKNNFEEYNINKNAMKPISTSIFVLDSSNNSTIPKSRYAPTSRPRKTVPKISAQINSHKNVRAKPKPYLTTEKFPDNPLFSRSRPNLSFPYRKGSHVVKKVIKPSKDMMMSEQRQNIKRPAIKVLQRPISSEVNFSRNNKIRLGEKGRLKSYKENSHVQQREPTVEVSPIQASTEKAAIDMSQDIIDLLNKDNLEYVRFAPNVVPEIKTTPLHLAVNTGFNPKSVVFERGFTPLTNENKEEGPEIENESEIGILNIPASAVANLTHKNFIRQRYDDNLDNVKPYQHEIRSKRQKSNNELAPINHGYLPPKEDKRIREDESTVVYITFDGRKVPGSTLTTSLDNKNSLLYKENSKIANFIRTRPQVGPFRGELPPLDPGVISSVGSQSHRSSLSRDLETPMTNSPNEIKKLVLRPRNKRSAHHTSEHTAEQMANSTDHHDHNSHSSATFTKMNSFLLLLSECFIFVVLSSQYF